MAGEKEECTCIEVEVLHYKSSWDRDVKMN